MPSKEELPVDNIVVDYSIPDINLDLNDSNKISSVLQFLLVAIILPIPVIFQVFLIQINKVCITYFFFCKFQTI